MAQHDYVIANGTGAAVRSDLNNGLSAIVSQNSGATAPATTYAYMTWADTTAGVMKMRNGANNAWISLWELDGTFIATDVSLSAGTAGAPSLYFTGDTNTGIYSPGADQVAVSTGGTARITVDASGNVNIDSNTVYVDAANNRVGIGTSSPVGSLHSVAVTARAALTLATPDTGNARLAQLVGGNNYSYGVIGIVAGDGTMFQDAFGLGSSSSPNGSFSPTLTWTTSSGQNLPGRVGIGTSPATALHLSASSPRFRLEDSDGGYAHIEADGGNLFLVSDNGASQANSFLALGVDGAERARIDSSGRLLVGTSTARGNFFNTTGQESLFEVEALGGPVGTFTLNNASGAPGSLIIAKSRGATAGSNVIAQNGDGIGRVSFQVSDGSEMVEAANIEAWVDGTPGANDMPGRLVFSTTADGAASPTERFRISSTGAQSSVIPGGSTLYPSFDCRAWVNFNGAGTVAIRGSGNVSSITDNGTGDYTVNFTTAMADANYAAVFGSARVVASGTVDPSIIQGNNASSYGSIFATGSVRVKNINHLGSVYDVEVLCVSIFR
jgi:hypothetical protein